MVDKVNHPVAAEIMSRFVQRTIRSKQYDARAKERLPGGDTRAATYFSPYPAYMMSGNGCYLFDVDGNKYLDLLNNYTSLIHGHAHPEIIVAANAQLKNGTVFGAASEIQFQHAEHLCDRIRSMDQIRYCNSGTEATLLAWRLMRAAGNKPKIAKFEGCYHGWHDYAQWSVNVDPENMGPADRPNMTPGSAGITDGARDTMLMLPLNENAFQMIEEHAHELAGVAIEPVLGGGMLTVDGAFLQKLREVTQKVGVLLHFDEVITGFRLAIGGWQELGGVLPDVATYGKIIGGGLPIGAVACSKEMVAIAQKTDDGFSAAGTFSGNPMTLATGAAMLKYLQENRHIYEDMMAKGEFLRNGFNDWTASKGYPFCMTGIGSMFQIHAKEDLPVVPRDLPGQDEEALAELQLYFRLNNVLLPWMHLAFFSAAHTQDDIEEMLRAFKASVEGVMNSKKDSAKPDRH